MIEQSIILMKVRRCVGLISWQAWLFLGFAGALLFSTGGASATDCAFGDSPPNQVAPFLGCANQTNLDALNEWFDTVAGYEEQLSGKSNTQIWFFTAPNNAGSDNGSVHELTWDWNDNNLNGTPSQPSDWGVDTWEILPIIYPSFRFPFDGMPAKSIFQYALRIVDVINPSAIFADVKHDPEVVSADITKSYVTTSIWPGALGANGSPLCPFAPGVEYLGGGHLVSLIQPDTYDSGIFGQKTLCVQAVAYTSGLEYPTIHSYGATFRQSVPVPLPLLGVGVAFHLSRKLRQRISSLP